MKKIFFIFSVSMLITTLVSAQNYTATGSYNIQGKYRIFDENGNAIEVYPENQPLVTVVKTRELLNNDGDRLHQIANEFSTEVGNKLKELYPAMIGELDYSIESINGNIRLTYTATIVPADDPQGYQLYFDHRGALSSGENLESVMDDSKYRMEVQKSIMWKKVAPLNHGSMLCHTGKTKVAKYANGHWIALTDSFFAW